MHSPTGALKRPTPPSGSTLLEVRLGTLFLTVALALLTFTLYYPVHSYSFFNIDDGVYVYNNPGILAPLDGPTITWAFTHSFAGNYDPLTFLAHNLAVHLFQLNPGRHHEVNVVVHVLDVVLLFWVLKRATGFAGRSLVVAALFAVHPINVENVAWVAELKTMLSVVFFFLALGSYQWYARRPIARRMFIVGTFYGLGLLAKPQVITLPFVLLLWDYWPLERIRSATTNLDETIPASDGVPRKTFPVLLKEKTSLFLIALVYAMITMVAEHKASPTDWPYTFSIRLGNAILSYSRYIGKAFWPAHLAFMYPHPGYSLRWGQVWASLLLLLALSAFVFAQRRRRPYLIVGWCWFVGTMVPTIGLIQIDSPAMADRYAYISYIGLFIMVCWTVAEWADALHCPRWVLPSISLAVLFILSVLSRHQISYWSDSVTLWTHSAQVTHPNWSADLNLGYTLQQRGESKEALEQFYKAAQDKPDDVETNLDIALAERERGNSTQAIVYYKKALAVSKNDRLNAQVWANMGHAYSALGDEVDARECYLKSVGIYTSTPVPPPRRVINWHGAWWRDLGPFVHSFVSSH